MFKGLNFTVKHFLSAQLLNLWCSDLSSLRLLSAAGKMQTTHQNATQAGSLKKTAFWTSATEPAWNLQLITGSGPSEPPRSGFDFNQMKMFESQMSWLGSGDQVCVTWPLTSGNFIRTLISFKNVRNLPLKDKFPLESQSVWVWTPSEPPGSVLGVPQGSDPSESRSSSCSWWRGGAGWWRGGGVRLSRWTDKRTFILLRRSQGAPGVSGCWWEGVEPDPGEPPHGFWTLKDEMSCARRRSGHEGAFMSRTPLILSDPEGGPPLGSGPKWSRCRVRRTDPDPEAQGAA